MDGTIDTTRWSGLSAGTAPSGVVDDARFIVLFETEYEPMLRLAFVMLRSQAQAQDVVHDSMAKLIERWDRVENPGGYLRATVVNRCRDVLRWHRRRSWLPLPEIESEDPDVEFVADLLDGLTPTRRAVVVLRFYEQCTIPEIAALLGIREGTVKSTLHRALRSLREEIEQ